MTVRDLIRRSLVMIGVLGENETPSAAQLQDAFQTLKEMLESWSTERLSVYLTVREIFTLVGSQGQYAMGPSGDFDTTRPQRIERAAILIGDQEYPIEIINLDQWANESMKSLSGSYPSKLYQDDTFPRATINLWPIPDQAYQLVLYSWKPLLELANANSQVEFPPGYLLAIRSNLAIHLCPEYGKSVSQELAAIAGDSKENIKRMNTKPMLLGMDSAVLGRKPFNIYKGE